MGEKQVVMGDDNFGSLNNTNPTTTTFWNMGLVGDANMTTGVVAMVRITFRTLWSQRNFDINATLRDRNDGIIELNRRGVQGFGGSENLHPDGREREHELTCGKEVQVTRNEVERELEKTNSPQDLELRKVTQTEPLGRQVETAQEDLKQIYDAIRAMRTLVLQNQEIIDNMSK